MLETKATSIRLQGNSTVNVGDAKETVVVMSAEINETWNSNVSTTIANQELYEKNKEECRADVDAFIAKVREFEDAGMKAIV